MPNNPNLPQLFRDVFRNAYIPFRDSETINMFLKEVDDFKYDNSEDLGNAFEMLLSIMGSQGDAGQFRTPRHASFNQAVCGIKPNDNFIMEFLYLYFIQNRETYLNSRVGARQRNLNKRFISSIRVPKISIDAQIEIVKKIQEEMLLIEQNKRLVEIFEKKISDKIVEVWGE